MSPGAHVSVSSSGLARAAASLLAASRVEERGRIFVDRIVAGTYRGVPLEIRFEQCQTKRSGIEPFTTVTLGADAAGASFYLGGAHVGYSSREAHVPFPQDELASLHLVGTPRALIAKLAGGMLGRRLAALPSVRVRSLDVGSYALRAGCSAEGIVLTTHGWPTDAAGIVALLDAVVELRQEILGSIAEVAGPGVYTLRHLPEVRQHEAARLHASAFGRMVAAAIVSAFVMVSLAGVAAMVLLLRPA